MSERDKKHILNAARAAAAAKLRAAGHKVRHNPTDGDLCVLIQRETGWPAPRLGSYHDYVRRYAYYQPGQEAARAREQAGLPATPYRPSLAMRFAAERAAQVQPRLIAATSNVSNPLDCRGWPVGPGREA